MILVNVLIKYQILRICIIQGTNSISWRNVTYLTVKRDKNNNIIDNYHKTIPILTKYEKTKIIVLRAVQIQNGLKPFKCT